MKWLIIPVITIVALLLLAPLPVLADTSEEVTVTATGYIAGAPGGLTLTYISDYEVGISWTKGEDAENTMVRAAIGRLPDSRTNGYLVYYGDGTSTSDTGVSLDETVAAVYYRAWSQNTAGVWEDVGVSDFLEGLGMTILAIAVIVLGLTIASFVFKYAILLIASSMGWVIFAFLMFNKSFEGNEYLNDALLLFGGAMAFLCAFVAIGMVVKNRSRPITEEDEYEDYKRKVLKVTRRRHR